MLFCQKEKMDFRFISILNLTISNIIKIWQTWIIDSRISGERSWYCSNQAVSERRIRCRIFWRSHRYEWSQKKGEALCCWSKHWMLHVLFPAQESILLVKLSPLVWILRIKSFLEDFFYGVKIMKCEIHE